MMLNFKKSAREIPLRHSSLAGFFTTKSKKMVQFESSLERDFVFLLEFDINIKEYLEQPLIINYTDKNGKKKTYTPDFAIKYFGNEKIEIVEIKYEKTLQSDHEKLLPKFNAAESFCTNNNYYFKIITEKYIRDEKGIELENYKFLSRFRDYFDNIYLSDNRKNSINPDMETILEKLKVLKQCTVTELINYTAKDLDKQSELLFIIWHLVASNFIRVDITNKLSTNSLIWTK